MPAPAPSDQDALLQFLYRAPIGLVQMQSDGQIEMINPMAAQLLMPLSADGALQDLFSLLEPFMPGLRERASSHAGEHGVICEETRVTLAPGQAGNASPQVLSVSLLKLDESRLMASLADVTLQVRREQQGLARRLSDAALVDNLTKMPNRDAVREHLQLALAHAAADPGRTFAVLLINCNRFRMINDAWGQKIGDEVLALIAARLLSTMRPNDLISHDVDHECVAARIGGDEFVILLDGLNHAEDVHPIAQRLLNLLARPYNIGARQIHCRVSLGIDVGGHAAEDADTVLQNASIAMREAKREGGTNYVIFEPAMQENAARRGGIEADLRQALKSNQLFVVYQPLVWMQEQASSTALAGLEALVRWQHPERGLMPPGEFIGIAEECGLIGEVGEFVLAEACREFVALQHDYRERAPGMIAVNLSRAQLHRADLVSVVAETLRVTGMHAGQLQLEVTESLAAQDAMVQTRLNELKTLHLTLALDDFGTGYSSLASLHQLPIDTVKIDRSFVSQADTSHHHRVLIDATVRVAKSLGMATVAEGIETLQQATEVRRLGCDKGQGYLYSKPLTAHQLRGWIEARSPSGRSPSEASLAPLSAAVR